MFPSVQAPCNEDERKQVVRHLPLVRHFVRKFRGPDHQDFGDLVACGCIGLIAGLRTFAPERGGALSTWVGYYIRSAILIHLKRTSSVVHRAIARKDICGDISLSLPRYDNEPDGETLQDTIVDASPDPEAEMLATERETVVRQALNDLGDDWAILIAHQVGATRREIGKVIGLTAGGVAAREAKAMRRLSYALADVR